MKVEPDTEMFVTALPAPVLVIEGAVRFASLVFSAVVKSLEDNPFPSSLVTLSPSFAVMCAHKRSTPLLSK